MNQLSILYLNVINDVLDLNDVIVHTEDKIDNTLYDINKSYYYLGFVMDCYSKILNYLTIIMDNKKIIIKNFGNIKKYNYKNIRELKYIIKKYVYNTPFEKYLKNKSLKEKCLKACYMNNIRIKNYYLL